MKIVSIETGILNTPLLTPFKTAVRRVDAMTDVLVRITDGDGRMGWGSAPPTGKVTGDTAGAILGAVDEHLRPALLGRDGEDLNGNLDVVEAALVGNASAKAALDIALHDLWAKTLGQPVWKLLGGSGADVETDVTISVNPPEEMARDALSAVKRGFKCLKTKVGVGAEIDFARLKAIREAVGPEPRIRIDANQGWEPAEAVRVLNRMADAGFGIELVEQPVKARDLKGMAYVTANSPIPVVADEACWSPEQALNILNLGAANSVNVKLMKCGGLRQARRITAVAESLGARVMIGCMLEGKVSCAAAVHLTSASSCIDAVDLDGPALCSVDPVSGGPQFDGPVIRLGSGAGFGVADVPGVKWNG
ncbi:dipeptide epimerase [Pyramidobacter piscolens]|uniref:dipeptide epimerase n=1 Tax=Pyramidobacter piscolens TaxID=638849 RepID=UPI0026651B83|nr:dipeptide epimerase [Pyramidobacter piscolens]